MKTLVKVILMVNKVMYSIAGVALVLIMSLTVADVFLRYIGRPIMGAYELVALGGGIAIGFALPYTSWTKTHVAMDMLLEKFPEYKSFLEVMTRAMALVLFGFLSWNLFDYASSLVRTGEGTLTLAIPLYPFVYSMAACCFVECFVFVAELGQIIYIGENHE